MAELKISILGDFTGKMGNIVIKRRNGKRYGSKAPESYTVSQLPHEIDKRNKQKVNGKFASVINRNHLLHAVWDKEKAPCTTAYNKICKVNYHLCEPDHPSAKAKITPGGFRLEIEEINVMPDRIEILPHPVKLNKSETEIRYIMILSLWNPKRKSKNINSFEFLPLENYTSDGLKLIFNLNKPDILLAKKYKNKTVFLAAVTLDKESKIKRCSETLARD